MKMRSIILFLTLVSFPAWSRPWVLLFPVLGSPTGVTFSGRVFKHALPQPNEKHSALRKNVSALLGSNYEGAAIEIRFLGLFAKTVSGDDGNFSVSLMASQNQPFPSGYHSAEASIKGGNVGQATIEIIDPAAPFYVISDFDDTVAVTNVISTKGLVKSALLSDETSQPAVSKMAEFYRCLKAQPKSQVSLALVSGSPVQYVPRVLSFLNRNQFPLMSVYLRDLSPNTLRNYKQPVIRSILKSIDKPVILIGDSGEHDPEVYKEMAAEFPGKVKAIYIRNAGHTESAERFTGMFLFNDASEAAADAVANQYISQNCFNESVSPLEKK
jgi:phosphatidate phosphatase APP1